MHARVFRAAAVAIALAGLATAWGFSSKKKDEAPEQSTAASSSDAAAADRVWVYRPDGGVSCEKEGAQQLDIGSKELQSAGVQVFDSRKTHDNKMRAQMCGMPTGSLNGYQISKDDLPKALSRGFKQGEAFNGVGK